MGGGSLKQGPKPEGSRGGGEDLGEGTASPLTELEG